MTESRVWGMADPRFLNIDDLHAEHKTVHLLCSRSKSVDHPDHARFWEGGPRAKSLLILRHELIRVAFNLRWPGHHARDKHPTMVNYRVMLPQHKRYLVKYAKSVKDERKVMKKVPWNIQHRFGMEMHKVGFPGTENTDRKETPWDFEGITFQEYVELGDRKPEIKKATRRKAKWKPGRRT